MNEYPHIDTIYKRDQRGRILEGDYSTPELEYLAMNQWVGTEKVDGTNIRVMWRPGETPWLGGKTDNAQIPAFLVRRLEELFVHHEERFVDAFPSLETSDSVCVYGEGYGAKIQKGGGNYNPTGVDFTLFDVRIGAWWLRRDGIEAVARAFGVTPVPITFTGTLPEACEMARLGFESAWGPFMAEGLVLKPAVEMTDRKGNRILTKIKHRDFAVKQRGKE